MSYHRVFAYCTGDHGLGSRRPNYNAEITRELLESIHDPAGFLDRSARGLMRERMGVACDHQLRWSPGRTSMLGIVVCPFCNRQHFKALEGPPHAQDCAWARAFGRMAW